jgi:hypothetical protein
MYGEGATPQHAAAHAAEATALSPLLDAVQREHVAA